MLEVKRPTQTELDRMSAAEKDALILSLFDVLEGFGRRLREREGKVEKTRKNSSKPPSSAGLKKAAAEPRKKGERPVGGVPGHPGATHEMTDTPDRVEELRPQGLCECGAYLAGLDAVAGERRRHIEMPEPRATVTEYRQTRWAWRRGTARLVGTAMDRQGRTVVGPLVRGRAAGGRRGGGGPLRRKRDAHPWPVDVPATSHGDRHGGA